MQTGISIHALRVEGDSRRGSVVSTSPEFLSTPSGWRATSFYRLHVPCRLYFYPRPPGGGRPLYTDGKQYPIAFLSTPSGWRATSSSVMPSVSTRFLSTPSGWRATRRLHGFVAKLFDFYPRPPGGGRHRYCRRDPGSNHFYPRPPGGGRPLPPLSCPASLRDFYPRPPGGGRRFPLCSRSFYPAISIHALRVEGDCERISLSVLFQYFYPRPPGGERPPVSAVSKPFWAFLSTPSGWRATFGVIHRFAHFVDFYPRPPGGGRRRYRRCQ